MMIRAQESSDMESMALSEPSRQADLAVQQGNHEDNVKAAQVATMCGLRVHEWGLNPMFWTYVKLFSKDVHAMDTLDGIDDSHVLHGKAVQRVEVFGIAVHIKPGQTKTLGGYVKYLLDDGTGLLACTQYERSNRRGAIRQGHAERHELGDFLIVQGKLKRYRGEREVTITSVRKPADPNEEILQRLQCVELARMVYKPPFMRHEYIDHELVLSSSQARASLCECNSPYADAIGYCRCVAPRLACDPSFKFRDALLADLAAKERSLEPGEHLRFQFARDIRDNPALREAAESVVLQAREGSVSIGGGMGMVAKTGEGGRADGTIRRQTPIKDAGTTSKAVLEAKVMELLRAVMFSLHRDGAVHFSDRVEDVYVLLSRGRVLEPRVKAVCVERGLGWAHENEIIRALQSTAILHYVPGARIRACIKRLKAAVEESDYAL